MKVRPEVVFDARWLRTGIGRYILTLLSGLKSQLNDAASLTCITMPEHVGELEELCDRVIPLSCGIYTLKEQLVLPRMAREASIFCSPHYNAPILRPGPLVLTVHDVTHLIFDAYRDRLSTQLYARPMVKMACARALKTVVPSEYSRRMLVEHLGVDAHKLQVIPCAVGDAFKVQDRVVASESVRLAHGVSDAYILAVTSPAPHKNLPRLLRAYCELRGCHADFPELVLVLPGDLSSHRINPEMATLIENGRVRCLSQVSDSDLADLYAAAMMTVLPSIEEGFGLPVIEAMACGTPVACSRTSALPEIAGESAVYFDPYSVEDMSHAILGLAQSTARREALSTRGLAQAATYSPDRLAREYVAVLKSILNHRVV